MSRSNKKSAWIRVESSYATEPDADGSDYAWMPTFSVGEIPSGTEQLPTDYMTGRGLPTSTIPGADGGSVEIVTPVIGLPTEAGDGIAASAGADDWYDDCWENHVSDTAFERTGNAITSATTADITFDVDPADLVAQDLIAVYDASSTALAARSQIALLSVDGGASAWTVAPAFATAPTSAGVAYAGRSYIWSQSSIGGSSRAITIRDDEIDGGNTTYYRCLGGRITSRSIVAEAGQRFEDRMTWSFDSIVEDRTNKTGLPAPGIAPAVTPLVCMLSPVWFNGTAYATKRVEINFNIEAQAIAATSGTNGRSGWDILSCNPTVTIEPLRTDALRDLKRAGGTGRLLVQLGAGIFGTVVNACAFHAELAQVMEAEPSDDGNRARQTVTFKVVDPGIFTAPSTLGRFWQFARF